MRCSKGVNVNGGRVLNDAAKRDLDMRPEEMYVNGYILKDFGCRGG